ncbi:uncharacterized protein LOC129274276 [Lytechinus pictus]|uniref:uncharacterized protein LOC129274276 n=1 Tax=Lytechinus pictus TaxID=7653 RepID=UPI0030BA11BA
MKSNQVISFSYGGVTVSASDISKEQNSGVNTLRNISSYNRRFDSFRTSSEGFRVLGANDRTLSKKFDVSVNSSVSVRRPLPPLVKNNTCKRSRRELPSYFPLVAPKPVLPPINPKKKNFSRFGEDNNNGISFHSEDAKPQNRPVTMTTKLILNDSPGDAFDGECFLPLWASTPKNSQTILRSQKSRPLPIPIDVVFRQSSGTSEQDTFSSSYTKALSTCVTCDIHDEGVRPTGKRERRKKLSRDKTKEWVKSSDFALKTADDEALSSLETGNFQTLSSVTFSADLPPKDCNKPKSTDHQLRKIVSSLNALKPPSLPFRIVVHERLIKFSVDLQFRVQFIKDWWREIRFPRLPMPKITIDIDFATFTQLREPLREFCARLRESLRYPKPIILDPPPRYVHIPPSAVNLHDAALITDERKRRKLTQSLLQYDKTPRCSPLRADVTMVDDDLEGKGPRCVFKDRNGRCFKTGSGLHVTFADEQQEDDQDSSPSKAPRINDGKPMPVTKNEQVSEKQFNSARKRLAAMLKKLDDPSWYETWIKENDQFEMDLKGFNPKKLDLIRALIYAIEHEPCQRLTIHGKGEDEDSDRGAIARQMMRVHQQFAHHRFGMSQRQPSTGLGPAMHPGATAYGIKDVGYCSVSTHIMYTDDRAGCLACRVLKAARRFGCEDRLASLLARPTIGDCFSRVCRRSEGWRD